MSSTLNTLIEGVSEIQRGNFSTAIELLEEYCQNYKTDSEGNYSEYIYAQQHIVKAYGYLGDKAKAIQRTKELATNGHPQVRKWAKRVLAYLSPEAYQSLPQEVIESDNQPLWDSESAKLVLYSVNDYLEFGSNSHVVETLETACESLKFNTKEHLYAQVLLIEAYHLNGQSKNAIALCNQLLDSKHYVTRLLANQYLSSLSQHQSERRRNTENNTKLLTSREASVIYQQGYNALIDKNYAEAFEIFEKYCESALPGTREYLQASKYLINFYQNSGEFEQATSFCIKLITSKHKPSHRWARELLYTDLFRETPPDNPIETSKIDSVENRNSSLYIEKVKTPIVETQPQNSISTTSKSFRLKSLDEFKQFHKQNLLKYLRVFEARRKQALATIIVCNITAFATLFFISQLPFIYPAFTYLLPITLLLIIYSLFYNAVFKGFTYKLDDKITQKIYQFINTNQNLTISTAFSEEESNKTLVDLQNSQLLNSLRANNIKQNHVLHGNINNIYIRLATVDIHSNTNNFLTDIFYINWKQDTTILIPILLVFRLFKSILYIFKRIMRGKNIDFQQFKTKKLQNKSYNYHFFKGLFFTAKSNKFLYAPTIIKPKLLENDLNLLFPRKQLIIEDPEFNSLFTVYSEDQVQARYILSASLMEKLVQFRKKANRNIYVSFVDDMIYVAVEYPEGIFEPNLFKSMLKFAPLREYFEAIQLMLGIIEDLKE